MEKIKNNLLQISEYVVWVVFFAAFTCISISTTQVFKDTYYYIATSALLLFVMIVRRLKIFSWYNLSVLAVYGASALHWLYLHRFDWGYQYARLLALRFCMYGLFLVIVLDLVITGKKSVLQLKKSVFTILFLVAFGVAVFVGLEYLLIVLCPVLAWYFTPMSKERWERTVRVMAQSSFVTFCILMTVSLVVAPKEFISGRYVGIFVFPAACSVMALSAVVATLYLWKISIKNGADKKKTTLLHALQLVYPMVGMLLTFNRAAWIALFFIVLIIFIFSNDDKKVIKKKSIISGAVLVGLVLVFCLTIKIMLAKGVEYSVKTVDDVAVFESTADKIYYYFFAKSLLGGSKTGVFPERTFLNALDCFSSDRVGIWYTGLKQAKIIGQTELSVVLPTGEFVGHVHSTYIDWCMRLGYIGGILLIVWFFAYLTKAVKIKLGGDNTIYYTLFWWAFCFGVFIVERELWTNLPAFMLLLMQYPLLIRFIENNEE